MKNKTSILLFLLVITFGTFTFFVFKNIKYPLMWGDEAETALYAGRVLDFGYPKIHKNGETYKLVMVSGDVGVNKKYDANTTSLWGQYYFGAVGEYFARKTSDLYLKTAYLRIPFALIGFLGVVILPFSILKVVSGKTAKVIFLILYFFLQILSISLILHMREVRSYSMSIFLSSVILVIFANYYFRRMSNWIYTSSVTVLAFILLNSFPPGYMALVGVIGSYAFLDNLYMIYREKLKGKEAVSRFFNQKFIITILPLAISGLLAIPVLKFFGTAKYSAQAYADIDYTLNTYLNYVFRVFSFLLKHQYLGFAVLIKLVSIYLYKKYYSNRGSENILGELIRISNFFHFFIIIYALLICITPYLFDRYFVFLQPVLALTIVFDLYINCGIFKDIKIGNDSKNALLVNYYFGVMFAFLLFSLFKIDTVSGYVYQMTHRYVGPMDMIVDYIKVKFGDTKDLTIDTEIEQDVILYYLGAKVLCDNIENCFSAPPDIIIPRRYLMTKDFIERSNQNLSKSEYQQVLIPILDYPSNNIPEFTLSLRHLFKTPQTSSKNEQITLFIKK